MRREWWWLILFAMSACFGMQRRNSVILAIAGAWLAVVQLSNAQPTPGIPDDELLAGRPDLYSAVVDEAVDCLKKGDAECFRSILSKDAVSGESGGADAVNTIIKTRFIPFFADCIALTDTVTTIPTWDSSRNSGLAFFRTCETSSGVEKPFVIYVINQKGSLVVGNLLLNKTLQDVRGVPSR